MARTKQDWYKGRTPTEYYADFCSKRNHRLISLSGVANGSGIIAKGKMTFFCNTCEMEITTTVASYRAVKKNSPTAGCKNCKKILAKKREKAKYPNKNITRTRLRRRIWTNHSPLKSREASLQHLRSVPNEHNLFVLKIMNREPPQGAGKLYKHHIIPCHDGGEERKSNEILVTLKEHWEVHLLRLEAYQQAGEASMFFFCWKKITKRI